MIRALESFRDSLVVLWDAVSGADRYRVEWWDAAHGAFLGSKWVTQNAVQLQPLTPDAPVQIVVTSYTAAGAGARQEIAGVAPRGTYEAGLAAMIEAGGFWYDAKHDRAMAAVEERYLKTVTNGNRWEPDYAIQDDFGWSGAYTNHQFHFHQFLCDGHAPGAVAAISSRAELPIDLSRNQWPVTVLYDCDPGPVGRATPYVILCSEKIDLLALKPVESDTKPITPTAYDIRWQGFHSNVDMRVFERSTLREYKRVSRGRVWNNVRQIMGFRLWPDRVELLIDRNYTGVPTVAHTVYTDLTTWPPSLWLYFTIGSYNGRKINNLYGHRPSGERIHQTPYALWHIGQVAHNGSAARLCSCEDGIIPHAGDEVGPVDPEPVSALDTMPPTPYLHTWVVPVVKVAWPHALQANRYPDKFNVTVSGDSTNATYQTGEALLLTKLRLERRDRQGGVRLLHEVTLPVPMAKAVRTLEVDTSLWPEGYYTLNAAAVTENGSDGENYTDLIYTADPTANILVWRKPANGKPPEMALSFQVEGEGVQKIGAGETIAVRIGKRFSLWCDIETKSYLTEIAMEMLGADGKWKNWLAAHNTTGHEPAALDYRAMDGGNYACQMTYSDYIYSWYPKNANNGLDWRVRVRDADGVETVVPFAWKY